MVESIKGECEGSMREMRRFEGTSIYRDFFEKICDRKMKKLSDTRGLKGGVRK